jgi:uncharacterized protein (TIGR00266 family)
MNIEILFRPSYSLAVVKLSPNEKVRVDAGAMVSMSQSVTIETKAAGGFLKSLTRSVLGGESFFQNFFQASAEGGEITLAPDLPGDQIEINLTGQKLLIQSGSYMASEAGIELDAKLSMKAFMSTEGISMLEAFGTGKLLLSSYGAIYEKTLTAGEKYTVDSSHLVAFDSTINVEPRTVGGFKSTMLSGEGLVVDLTGPGRLFIQTRSPKAFINWIIPQIPTRSSSS